VADTVIEPNPTDSLPPVSIAALMESAMRARKSGNLAASRALLRALATQQPNLPQVWLLLATVAETRAEQRHALEQVLALDPRSEPARRGLARMRAVETTPAAPAAPTNRQPHNHDVPLPTVARVGAAAAAIAQPALVPAPELVSAPAAFTPGESAEATHAAPGLRAADIAPVQAARDIRWPLYLVIGLSALVVLIAAILIRGSEFTAALRPAPTAPLSVLGATAPAVAPALETPAAPDAATAGEPKSGAATLPALGIVTPAALPQPTPSASSGQSVAPPTATPPPLPTPRKALTPGEVVEYGSWHAILIRPEDAVALDGSIGSFQPRGRFVLALLAIGNDGPAPARLPDDLFVLVDGSGKRYASLPQISTAYLNTYGRGQHGDLSMEDPIPSDGGNKSVPLIFDVPPSARPLYLLVGDSSLGWPIIP
jgi:hypothetical protein